VALERALFKRLKYGEKLMTRRFHLAIAITAAALSTGTALAQAQGGPAPGTANAANVTREMNDERQSYNQLIGKQTPTKVTGNKAVPANLADLTPGTQVRDKRGTVIGTVESVEADGAIVASAAGKVKVPVEGFGINKKGLLLSLTKAEFDAAVATATAAPRG
jgi:hypothetical protein